MLNILSLFPYVFTPTAHRAYSRCPLMFLCTYNCSIRKEYAEVADKALTTPSNTQHLMELKEFVENAEEKDLVELKDRMIEARHRFATTVIQV